MLWVNSRSWCWTGRPGVLPGPSVFPSGEPGGSGGFWGRGRGLPQACLCVSHRHSLESQAPLTDADFSPQDWVFIWPHWGPRPLSRGWQGRNGLTPPCRPLCSRRGHGAARVPVAPEHLAGCSGGGPVDNGPRRAHRQCRGRPLDLGSQRKQEALLFKGIGLTPFLDCGHKFNY